VSIRNRIRLPTLSKQRSNRVVSARRKSSRRLAASIVSVVSANVAINTYVYVRLVSCNCIVAWYSAGRICPSGASLHGDKRRSHPTAAKGVSGRCGIHYHELLARLADKAYCPDPAAHYESTGRFPTRTAPVLKRLQTLTQDCVKWSWL